MTVESGFDFSQGEEIFFHLHSIQVGFRAYPAIHPLGTSGFFCLVEEVGA
jgi:hypothetical protein